LLNPLIEPLASVKRRNSFLLALLLPITIGFNFKIHVADFFDSEHSLCEYIPKIIEDAGRRQLSESTGA
jgi:hypothetical protein